MGLYNYTELIEKALNKNQEAFAELYNSTCDLSFYIARQICNNSEDALDIVQNSYVKAFSNLDKLKKPESFPNWLARIVTNQTKDYLKKNYKVKFESIDISTELEGIDYRYNNYYGDIQPEHVLDKEETKKMIQEILDTLSIEQRMVTMMYYFEEMTTREIAVNLSCNENTVKSRLMYAKKQIEKSVLHFEKQGTKLYGLLPISFFSWLLTQGVEAYRLPHYITKEVLHNVISSVVGGGLLETIKINSSHIFKPLYSKVIAGTLAGTLVIGGSYFIYLRNKTPTEVNNEIAYVKVTEEESIKDNYEENRVIEETFSANEEISQVEDTQKETLSNDEDIPNNAQGDDASNQVTPVADELQQPASQPHNQTENNNAIALGEFTTFDGYYYVDGTPNKANISMSISGVVRGEEAYTNLINEDSNNQPAPAGKEWIVFNVTMTMNEGGESPFYIQENWGSAWQYRFNIGIVKMNSEEITQTVQATITESNSLYGKSLSSGVSVTGKIALLDDIGEVSFIRFIGIENSILFSLQ